MSTKRRNRLSMFRYWKGREYDVRDWFPSCADPREVKKWREETGLSFGVLFYAKSAIDYCTNCMTTSPRIPREHHPLCFDYKDLDKMPEPPPNQIGVCPECGSNEGLYIRSSREMMQSDILCQMCDYRFSGECCEEDLIEQFQKYENAGHK